MKLVWWWHLLQCVEMKQYGFHLVCHPHSSLCRDPNSGPSTPNGFELMLQTTWLRSLLLSMFPQQIFSLANSVPEPNINFCFCTMSIFILRSATVQFNNILSFNQSTGLSITTTYGPFEGQTCNNICFLFTFTWLVKGLPGVSCDIISHYNHR